MSHNPVTIPAGLDLDMIASDIADTLDRYHYGMDLSGADLRVGLVDYLTAALIHRRGGTVAP